METKRIFRALIFITLLMSSLATNAQSWSDCVQWFKSDGKYLLAHMAHHQDIKKIVFEETSPNIIVNVFYYGDWVDFSTTFEIVQGRYDGTPYFKTVKVIDEGCWTESTYAPAKGYYEKYTRQYPSYFKRLYGESSYDYLTKGQKAAAALMIDFLQDY